jgi:hypothetical protein
MSVPRAAACDRGKQMAKDACSAIRFVSDCLKADLLSRMVLSVSSLGQDVRKQTWLTRRPSSEC